MTNQCCKICQCLFWGQVSQMCCILNRYIKFMALWKIQYLISYWRFALQWGNFCYIHNTEPGNKKEAGITFLQKINEYQKNLFFIYSSYNKENKALWKVIKDVKHHCKSWMKFIRYKIPCKNHCQMEATFHRICVLQIPTWHWIQEQYPTWNPAEEDLN